MASKTKRLLILLALAAVLTGGALVGAQTDVELCESKGGTLGGEFVCLITQESDTHEIQHVYPLDVIGYDALEAAVDSFLQTKRDDFLALDVDLDVSPGPYTQNILPVVYNYYDDILSVEFLISEYTGGANANSYVQTFVYDIDADELLTLEDLFVAGSDPLSVIRPLAEAELRATYGEALFEDGLAEDFANYDGFTLRGADNALAFRFDQYQVAPGAAGAPTVQIPLYELSDILSDRVFVYRKG